MQKHNARISHCPRARLPSTTARTKRVKHDINVQQPRHSLTGRRRARGGRIRGVGLEEGADDVEEDTHAEGGDKERPFAPKGVDEEEYEDGGCCEFDEAVDA